MPSFERESREKVQSRQAVNDPTFFLKYKSIVSKKKRRKNKIPDFYIEKLCILFLIISNDGCNVMQEFDADVIKTLVRNILKTIFSQIGQRPTGYLIAKLEQSLLNTEILPKEIFSHC